MGKMMEKDKISEGQKKAGLGQTVASCADHGYTL